MPIRKHGCIRLLASLLFLISVNSIADVKMSAIFANNMVLQQNQKLPVWGWAEPGENVTVEFGGQKKETVADAQGGWMVKLDPLKASSEPQTMTISSSKTSPSPNPPVSKSPNLQITNILVGEVWLCSGQSNMALTVSQAKNAEQEISEADYPAIRQFSVFRKVSGQPERSLTGRLSWTVCTPDKVGGFTAVGYFFAREIYKALKIPVGIISASVGDTPAAAWTQWEVMEKNPNLEPILQRFKQDCVGSEEKLKDYQEWKKAVEEAKAAGTKPPNGIGEPMHDLNFRRPSGLFNGMINPLVPYAIRGVLWYQGEYDGLRAAEYNHLLPAMIGSWRQIWGAGDFPFYIVQLANYGREKTNPNQCGAWPFLREAQAATAAKLPNCGLAVAIDVGEAGNIHPTNKQEVGRRLSLLALSKDYGRKDIVRSGPVFKSMSIEGRDVSITFDSLGGGLLSKGEELKGFAVSGSDKIYYWADAKIKGDTVVLSSAKVDAPVAVRYAWGDNPACNLYNKEDLPAVPFRTDNW